jgi:uncharacterized protein (TIGR02145 family)
MKNKLKFLTALALLFIGAVHAQVGVGTTNPEPSSALDVTSTTQGFLPPRITYSQLVSITAPAEGLVVYCTDCTPKGLYVYDGSVWSVSSFSGSAISASSNGTAIVTAYSCATASAGKMTVGTPVSGVTQTITATVTRGGTYAISITANGVTFAATGTFAGTGAQNIVLTATGTPTAAGSTAFTLNTSPNCSFTRFTTLTDCYVLISTSPDVYKDFLCHNLGADTSLDPHTPVVGLQGAYIQWGQRGPNSTNDSSVDWQTAVNTSEFAAAPTLANHNNSPISGWNTTTAADNSWRTAGGAKTSNDPCPTGYRVPTSAEWTGVNTNNTASRTGTFSYSITNYGAALHYGPDSSTKLLTLPAAGRRDGPDGTLLYRGGNGYYWSSTESGSNAFYLSFGDTSVTSANGVSRAGAVSLRCIAE